jgi:putative ABC transport system substrate-binding protein
VTTRRAFIRTLTGGFLAAPLVAEGQQQGTRVPRIGILSPATSSATPAFEALRRGFRDLGYQEGRTIILEYRLASGDSSRLPALAVELVRLAVDVIVTDGGETPLLIANVVSSTPIVMATAPADPVAAKLVASFAHPGGHITGFTLQSAELAGKRIELFKQLVPRGRRVALLVQPAATLAVGSTEAAAHDVGLKVHRFEVNVPTDLDGVFKRIKSKSVDGILCLPSAMLWNQRARVVALVTHTRLPAVYPEREYVDAGGLVSYGPDGPANFYRAATYVDRILKGTPPGDLPIEQPTKFELVINLKTAKALGLTVPPLLMWRADEVIQ